MYSGPTSVMPIHFSFVKKFPVFRFTAATQVLTWFSVCAGTLK